MIFKIQPRAAQLYRILLITIVFSFLKLWDAAANATFSIDNVASLAKKLAAEPFRSGRRSPNFLEKMLNEGPASLTSAERAHLLSDAESMAALHHGVWRMSHSDSEPAVTQADQASAIKDQAMPAVDRSPDAGAHWQST